jgi:hypothetical protein
VTSINIHESYDRSVSNLLVPPASASSYDRVGYVSNPLTYESDVFVVPGEVAHTIRKFAKWQQDYGVGYMAKSFEPCRLPRCRAVRNACTTVDGISK